MTTPEAPVEPPQSGTAHRSLGADYFARRRRAQKLVVLVALVAALATLSYAAWYFSVNRRLPLGLPGADRSVVAPPRFLYAFAHTQAHNRLLQPNGVALSRDGRVYVVDSRNAIVRAFDQEGKYLFSFAKIADGERALLTAPVNCAVGPDGKVYVTDRRAHAIYLFSRDGIYERAIRPTEPVGKVFSPLAIAINRGGEIVVTDVGQSDAHRVLVLDPDGLVRLAFGATGRASMGTDSPGNFYFPAGVSVNASGTIFVADSNNHRVQVFDAEGTVQRVLVVQGLPRGLAVDTKGRLYVVDTLGHKVDVLDVEGDRIATFGEQGMEPGQFSFPNGIAVDSGSGLIFVADRENGQLQVWGWPRGITTAELIPERPLLLLWCLLPLALLAALRANRKQAYVITPDVLEILIAEGRTDVLRLPRARFIMLSDEQVAYQGRFEGGADLGTLVQPQEYSGSDAQALMRNLEISAREAAILAMAQRTKRLVTEDVDLRGLARWLRIDAFDSDAIISMAERMKRSRRGGGVR